MSAALFSWGFSAKNMQVTNTSILDASLYALAGFAAVIPLFYLNIRYARRLGMIDWPKARGLSDDHVPIIGPSLMAVALTAIGILMAFFPVRPWVLTTSAIIGVMGFLDDRRPLPALDKLFFQAVCATAVVCLDPHIATNLTSHFGMPGLFVGGLFILALVNAVNFIDGIDGLAGVVLLSAFAVLPLVQANHSVIAPYAILGCVIAGALVPFLYLNVLKRRGFLGNVGSYFFSFLVAVCHLAIPYDAVDVLARFSISSLCFLVPLADAATVITLRLWSQRSPFKADKGHLHHRLVQTNLPLRATLGVFGVIQLVGVVSCLYLGQTAFVGSGHMATVSFAGLALIATMLIVLLERASRIRVQAYFQRLDSGDPIYFLKYTVARADRAALKFAELKRLEAKFCAEIRVTDICVAQGADTLFLVLRTLAEPLRGISSRLESVIQQEKQYTFTLLERGDFSKRVGNPENARKQA